MRADRRCRARSGSRRKTCCGRRCACGDTPVAPVGQSVQLERRHQRRPDQRDSPTLQTRIVTILCGSLAFGAARRPRPDGRCSRHSAPARGVPAHRSLGGGSQPVRAGCVGGICRMPRVLRRRFCGSAADGSVPPCDIDGRGIGERGRLCVMRSASSTSSDAARGSNSAVRMFERLATAAHPSREVRALRASALRRTADSLAAGPDACGRQRTPIRAARHFPASGRSGARSTTKWRRSATIPSTDNIQRNSANLTRVLTSPPCARPRRRRPPPGATRPARSW